MKALIFDVQLFADISNSTSDTVVVGTADADSIYNYAKNVTINALEGNDSINSSSSNAIIYGGSGNDSIKNNYDSNVTIDGGDGNDTINNDFSDDAIDVMIDGGDGDDNIIIKITEKHYIFFSDNIFYYDDIVTIDGGNGNDIIETGNCNFVTINGSDGDDYIHNAGVEIHESKAGGTPPDPYEEKTVYDIIDVVDSSYGIYIIGTPVYYTKMFYGSYVIMIGGEGNDTIKSDGGRNIILSGSAGNDLLEGSFYNNDVDYTYYSSASSINNHIETFVYDSGNDTIQNYESGEILNFAATYTGWTTDGNDLVINAAEGSVRITDAKDKLVEVADANGNVIAHVYMAGNYEGAIDGRGFDKFEVISGADNVSNQIYACEIGSSMWGGNGNSNDELYGNSGYDEFVYHYGNGQDNIFNANAEDAVNLNGVNLEQIASAEITDSGVNLKFTDGGALNINGQVGSFILSGQKFGANYQSKTWYAK